MVLHFLRPGSWTMIQVLHSLTNFASTSGRPPQVAIAGENELHVALEEGRATELLNYQY